MMNFFGNMPGLQTGMGGMALGNAFNAGPSQNFQPPVSGQPMMGSPMMGGRMGINPRPIAQPQVMRDRPQVDRGSMMGMRAPNTFQNNTPQLGGAQPGLWQMYNSYRNA